jgi:hypothetical protein
MEAVVAYSRNYPSICLKDWGKPWKPSQDGWCPSKDSNWAPSKYSPECLPLDWPARPHCFQWKEIQFSFYQLATYIFYCSKTTHTTKRSQKNHFTSLALMLHALMKQIFYSRYKFQYFPTPRWQLFLWHY